MPENALPSLFGGFFQLGYVTNNLDAALKAFRERFGSTEFMLTSPKRADSSASPTKHIALAYIDDVMIEIIEPDAMQATIYDDVRPTTDGPITLHHLGYLVDDHQGNVDRLNALGYDIPLEGRMGEVLDYCYADTRKDTGHFSEYIRLGEDGRKWFDSVPRNMGRRTG